MTTTLHFKTHNNLVYEGFFDALIHGDRKKCSEITGKLLDNDVTLEDVYENIIRRALYEVGDLWERGKISVASEHLASATAESLINEFYSHIVSGEKLPDTVLVGCVENEYHQIGIKMVSDIFEKNGWNTHFLGASTPTLELVSFIDQTRPDMVALSLSLYFNLPYLDKMLNALDVDFPDLPVMVGGQAFRHGGKEVIEKHPNAIFQKDLKSLNFFLSNYKAKGL